MPLDTFSLTALFSLYWFIGFASNQIVYRKERVLKLSICYLHTTGSDYFLLFASIQLEIYLALMNEYLEVVHLKEYDEFQTKFDISTVRLSTHTQIESCV